MVTPYVLRIEDVEATTSEELFGHLYEGDTEKTIDNFSDLAKAMCSEVPVIIVGGQPADPSVLSATAALSYSMIHRRMPCNEPMAINVPDGSIMISVGADTDEKTINELSSLIGSYAMMKNMIREGVESEHARSALETLAQIGGVMDVIEDSQDEDDVEGFSGDAFGEE